MNKASSFSFLVVALLGGSAFAKSIFTPESLKNLPKDPKESCLIAGTIYAGGMGDLKTVRLVSSATPLPIETQGVNSLTEGDEFIFVDVPKGAFRITLVAYKRVLETKLLQTKYEVTSFGKDAFREHFQAGLDEVHRGDAPNEMSGTCDGGFIWLGLFKADTSTLRLGNDSTAAEHTLNSLKGELKGTPWANEIDHPAKSAPLPPGQDISASTAKIVGPKVVAGVTLVSPGAEPRTALHYTSKPSAARTAVLSLVTGNKPGTNQPLPQVQFTMNTTVVPGSDRAAPMKYTYAVTQATAAPSDMMGNTIAKMMTDPAVGLTGFVQFDDHGLHTKGDYQFAPGKAPKIGPPSSVVGGIGATVVPLPGEEVGVGGSWLVDSNASAPTFTTKGSTTYKVESIAGDVVKLSLIYDSTTTFKKAISLGAGKPSLVGTVVHGTGTAQIDLKRLVPDNFKQTNQGTNLVETASGPPQKDTTSSTTVTALESK